MSALGYHQFNRDRDAIRSQFEQHRRSFPDGHSEPRAPIAIDVPDMCSPDLWGAFNDRTQVRGVDFAAVLFFIGGAVVAASLIGWAITAAFTAYNAAILGGIL